MSAPRVGDTIAHVGPLNELPGGAVLVDAYGGICQHMPTPDGALAWWRWGQLLPHRAYLPAVVVYLPDAPPRPERVIAAEALHEAGEEFYKQTRRTAKPVAIEVRRWLQENAERIKEGGIG